MHQSHSRILAVLSAILCSAVFAQQPSNPKKIGAAHATAPAPGSNSVVNPRISSGPINSIGKFANSTDLVSSSMTEVNGNVGIFAANPLISLDVRTGSLPQTRSSGYHRLCDLLRIRPIRSRDLLGSCQGHAARQRWTVALQSVWFHRVPADSIQHRKHRDRNHVTEFKAGCGG